LISSQNFLIIHAGSKPPLFLNSAFFTGTLRKYRLGCQGKSEDLEEMLNSYAIVCLFGIIKGFTMTFESHISP
jgi:hypothetical protein